MSKFENWIKKNKKIALIGGTVILAIGSGISYVVGKNRKIPFEEWLKLATTDELNEIYEKFRIDEFLKTGKKPYEMEKISQELGERGAKEWFRNHPPNLDPFFRWTDANRWEK